MSALRDLIKDFNRKIKKLEEANIRIYDRENEEWHLSEIKYDSDEDRVIFLCDCKE